MIGDGERILAVIPARGGSKGLPRKNVLPLGGKPIIAWSIDTARAVSRIDRLVVSTDDPEIRQTAERWGGCEVLARPADLAADATATEPVLLHAADELADRFEWILALQPTSPLRQPADIETVLDLAEHTGAPSVLSVAPAPKPPHWHFSLGTDGSLTPFFDGPLRPRRQDQAATVVPNGSVYLARKDVLREWGSFYGPGMRAYQMPQERSIDIDTAIDLDLAALVLARMS